MLEIPPWLPMRQKMAYSCCFKFVRYVLDDLGMNNNWLRPDHTTF